MYAQSPVDRPPQPRLRPDLVISRQVYRGRVSYLVKDPVGLRYHRIGERELHLAGLLNGQRDLPELAALMEKAFPDNGMDEAMVARIVDQFAQLCYLQLSATQATSVIDRLREAKAKRQRQFGWFSILSTLIYWKIKLFDPDWLLLKMDKRLGFLWSRVGVILLAGLMGLCAFFLFSQWDRFWNQTSNLFSTSNLIWLWLSLIGIKVIHEFGHGLACKHFGGEVHEMGAIFMVFTPFLFCNATDSWMFKNKWHKIIVNLGGIYLELFVAGFAFLFWTFSPAGLMQQLAFNIMIICSFTTIVFNINPLLKFDGYYVLADWMEVPNLKDRSLFYLMNWVVKLFTGTPIRRLEGERHLDRFIFASYAFGSYIWGWLVAYGIVRFMGTKLEPIGLGSQVQILAGGVLAGGALMPLVGAGREVIKNLRGSVGGSSRRRAVLVTALLCGLFAGAWYLPYHRTVGISCVVDGGNRVPVHAQTPGFVRSILVKEGDKVVRGQVLARVENDLLQYRLEDVKYPLQTLELMRRGAIRSDRASVVKRVEEESSQYRSVQDKLVMDEQGLEIRTPVDGVVLTPDLHLFSGMYFPAGEKFCEVLPQGEMEVVLPLSERIAGLVKAGQSVEFRMYASPGKVFIGKVNKVLIAPARELPDAALSLRRGGEVPTEMDYSGTERPAQRIFMAEIYLKNTEQWLRPGMSGRARIDTGETTLGRVWWTEIKYFFRNNF